MSYQVIRLFKCGRPPKVIRRKLSLEEARIHCQRPDTRGEGWFDAFRQVGFPCDSCGRSHRTQERVRICAAKAIRDADLVRAARAKEGR